MRSLLLGLSMALLNISLARADQLTTGPVDAFGTASVCYLINLGSTNVTVSSIGIYDETSLLPTISNTCSATLRPGKTCRTVSSSPGVLVCRAVVSDKTNIRGDFQARAGSVTTAHQALR